MMKQGKTKGRIQVTQEEKKNDVRRKETNNNKRNLPLHQQSGNHK
jgi:hypothetical protein